MPFCMECGTEYSAGKFCASCGAGHGFVNVASENETSKAAANASALVISLCDNNWSQGFDDVLSLNDFQAFTVGDWQALGNYLREKANYFYGESNYERWYDATFGSDVDESAIELAIERSEFIAGVVIRYIDSLDPRVQQLELLASAGFLGCLPAEVGFLASGENIIKELDVIFNTLGVGSASSHIGESFDGVIPALSGLSDFGLSALIPHLGKTAKERAFLETLAPTPGVINISMTSLMYLNNPAINQPDIQNILISPRTLYLLFDDRSFPGSDWMELDVWDIFAATDIWKGYVNVRIKDWDLDELVVLASNGLDGSMYPKETFYRDFMSNRREFKDFLKLLKTEKAKRDGVELELTDSERDEERRLKVLELFLEGAPSPVAEGGDALATDEAKLVVGRFLEKIAPPGVSAYWFESESREEVDAKEGEQFLLKFAGVCGGPSIPDVYQAELCRIYMLVSLNTLIFDTAMFCLSLTLFLDHAKVDEIKDFLNGPDDLAERSLAAISNMSSEDTSASGLDVFLGFFFDESYVHANAHVAGFSKFIKSLAEAAGDPLD